MSLLILVRHGKSLWNKENRFTGWTDIPLSNEGIKEAESAAREILDQNISINIAYSSIFSRAYETGKIMLQNSQNKEVKLQKDWRLNERHYGKLQGLNKSETASRYGDSQVLKWRRSFNTKPPLLSEKDHNSQLNNPLFKDIPKEKIPVGESLQDTVNRVNDFCKDILYKKLDKNKNILIAAHGNSIRALIKIIENISDKSIEKLEIVTGEPIYYTFKNNNFKGKSEITR
ncbi:MAG: 2,3-diphosphoglycerate-dependent phosphoglycerate mutase [Chloroflexota bacterium]|nr:2,3-diphosphoglycerate-dependent phosphoglycerate mutase [Chloroflexota bacterium]